MARECSNFDMAFYQILSYLVSLICHVTEITQKIVKFAIEKMYIWMHIQFFVGPRFPVKKIVGFFYQICHAYV